jgi:hypothetical protein
MQFFSCKTTRSSKQNQANAIKAIKLALKNEKNFNKYKLQIIQKFYLCNHVYIKATVDTINESLKDTKQKNTKILALMLLKESMDTQEQALVETVSDEILDTLQLLIQDQTQYLPQDPDKRQAFLQLLGECLVIWNDWFGLDEQRNPTKYQETFEIVFSKIEKPLFFLYYTKPQSFNEGITPQEIPQPENSFILLSPVSIFQIHDDDDDAQEDLCIEKMKEFLKHIEKNKGLLYEQMVTLENPEEKAVNIILKNLTKITRLISENWNEFEGKKFSGKDKFAKQILLNCELIEDLMAEFNRQIGMEEFRIFVIRKVVLEK